MTISAMSMTDIKTMMLIRYDGVFMAIIITRMTILTTLWIIAGSQFRVFDENAYPGNDTPLRTGGTSILVLRTPCSGFLYRTDNDAIILNISVMNMMVKTMVDICMIYPLYDMNHH
jgi:hypothetical protein